MIVALLMFLLALWHIRGKPGRAWAAIRQSEPAALAAGVNVTLYKLWAFALASFVTGIAGALLGSASHVLYAYTFPTSQSIVLFAVVLMGGIYSLWGAVVAGVLLQVRPGAFTWSGGLERMVDDPLRRRRAAGPDDGAGRHRAPVPARPRQAQAGRPGIGPAARRRRPAAAMIEVRT